MQLGKALIGGIVGGVIGIALLVVIHAFTGWDKAWLAIPVAILTGLGVRWAVATKGHPSYTRGAVTAILAMAAFFAWYPVQTQLATRRAMAMPAAPSVAANDETDAEDAADAGDAADAPIQTVRLDELSPRGGSGIHAPRQQQWSVWDFVSLCVAAFVAYELGRGSGTKAPPSDTTKAPGDPLPPAAVGQTPMPPD